MVSCSFWGNDFSTCILIIEQIHDASKGNYICHKECVVSAILFYSNICLVRVTHSTIVALCVHEGFNLDCICVSVCVHMWRVTWVDIHERQGGMQQSGSGPRRCVYYYGAEPFSPFLVSEVPLTTTDSLQRHMTCDLQDQTHQWAQCHLCLCLPQLNTTAYPRGFYYQPNNWGAFDGTEEVNS